MIEKISNPLVSIITATYNAEKFLPCLVNSIRNQKYKNFEWIVVDGNSTDKTLEIIKANIDIIKTLITEKDDGIFDAWNKGITCSQGDWICFLGADDEIFPNALVEMVDEIQKFTHPVDFVSGKIQLSENGQILQIVGKPWNWKTIKKYMCVAHPGAFHSKEFIRKNGLFDKKYRAAGDFEYILRAGDHLSAKYVEKILVKMDVGGISRKNSIVFYEVLNAKLKHHVCSYFQGTLELFFGLVKWKLMKIKMLITRN